MSALDDPVEKSYYYLLTSAVLLTAKKDLYVIQRHAVPFVITVVP
jgi:hypothetical protein